MPNECIFHIKEGELMECKGDIEIIEIPDGVRIVSGGAFANCTNLKHIFIPSSVESLSEKEILWGGTPFYSCKNLKDIIVSDDNNFYKSIDGNLYTKDGKTLIQYAIGRKDDSFTVPEGITSIASSAFFGCCSLTKVKISNSVTNINEGAFFNCSNLKEIFISKSVMFIANNDWISFNGGGAFENCENLSKIIVSKDNSVYKSIDGNLYTKDGKTLIQYASGKKEMEFTVPDTVIYIKGGAFQNCQSLKNICFSNNIKKIGSRAFCCCRNLTNIILPNKITEIKEALFASCENLVEIGLPHGIKRIERDAFYGCTSLTKLIIPNTVVYIEYSAFCNCNNLSTIDLPESLQFLELKARTEDIIEGFAGIGEGAKQINISSNNTIYKSIDGNLYSKDGRELILYASGKTEEIFVVPKGVNVIQDYAFSLSLLKHIIIPHDIAIIGEGAFQECDNLTIYCEAQSKPIGWKYNWNPNNRPVIWGYKNTNWELLRDEKWNF